MMLVAYAGKPAITKRQDLAYRHFKLGRDTTAISEMLRITEATALRWINAQRSIEKSLPSPYKA